MNVPDDPAADNVPRTTGSPVWLIVTLWTLGLMLATGVGGLLLMYVIPYLLLPLFPRGRFMPFLFRLMPLMFLALWLAGIYGAYRVHRSRQVIISMTIISGILFFTSPIWGYLLIILLCGGWNVK